MSINPRTAQYQLAAPPSPSQPWKLVPNYWGCHSHSYWRGQAHREVAGNGAVGLSLWDPSSPQHMLLVSGMQGLTHLSRVPHSCPGHVPDQGCVREGQEPWGHTHLFCL